MSVFQSPLVRLVVTCLALLLADTARAQLLSPETQRQNPTTGTRSETGTGKTTNDSTRGDTTTTPLIQELDPRNSLGTGTRNGNLPRDAADGGTTRRQGSSETGVRRAPPPPKSSEFARYASRIAGQTLGVVGSEFFSRDMGSEFALQLGAGAPAVPPDYLVNVGDELLIQISGSFEAELRQQVRRGGEIALPRVGTMRVAGLQAGELAAAIKTRLESQLRNIDVTVSFAALRGMRIFVTGFVDAPGAHVVDSLSTISSALYAAGGPSEGGSYRVAELWRRGKKLTSFDLYAFLIRGDKSLDLPLTAEDVIRVAPASSFQVAITGSVNRTGVYELLPAESLDDLLAYSGGYTPVAERGRLAAVEIDERGQRRMVELRRADTTASPPLTAGAVLHVFSAAALKQGINATRKIVHVDGEVARPGSYVLPAASSIADAIAAAGGPTGDAYTPGLTLVRPTLAREQEFLLNRSLDELERSVFEASATVTSSSSESGQGAAQAAAATKSYIERLRQFRPTGRLIISRAMQNPNVQPLLQDGDRVTMPSKPVTVSVFGAVYGEGSYLAASATPLSEFLTAAGGLRPGADEGAIVVLKGDGSFVAANIGFFSSAQKITVEPGDSIFVPTDAQRGRFWSIAKDIGTMLYQFGLGAAALKVLN